MSARTGLGGFGPLCLDKVGGNDGDAQRVRSLVGLIARDVRLIDVAARPVPASRAGPVDELVTMTMFLEAASGIEPLYRALQSLVTDPGGAAA